MFTERTSVGLDVHALSVRAAALDTVTGQLIQETLTPSPEHVRDWLRRVPQPVAAIYEAGPTGFGLQRGLVAAGIRCEVAAPSKLIRPSGDRVKTDKRDAIHLARLLHLDEYTPVTVPSVGQESARDLARAREQAREDLTRAKHRLTKLQLRHGIVYSGGKAWTGTHLLWLSRAARRQELTTSPGLAGAGTSAAFEACLDAVLTAKARRDRLDAAIHQIAIDSEYTAMIRRLGCLRGVSELTAFGLAVEIGGTAEDWQRFTGHTIGSFVGLVPSEDSSGGTRRQGSITKAGNKHVRRLLIEAAWHHRKPYQPGVALRRRWDQAPPAAKARGDQANQRLHRRWETFDARNKKTVIANTAIARELAGFAWSLAVMDD
jgi:transposase